MISYLQTPLVQGKTTEYPCNARDHVGNTQAWGIQNHTPVGHNASPLENYIFVMVSSLQRFPVRRDAFILNKKHIFESMNK